VAKALDKAPADRKARLEDVILRIDAETDQETVTLGSFEFKVQDSAFVQELDKDGKAQLRLKAVFEGSTIAESPVTLTITKAVFVTAKEKLTLLVVGAKGEPFTRKFDPMIPKMFEYGSILPPRWPPGTRGALVFEIEANGKKQRIRTKIAAIEKKE